MNIWDGWMRWIHEINIWDGWMDTPGSYSHLSIHSFIHSFIYSFIYSPGKCWMSGSCSGWLVIIWWTLWLCFHHAIYASIGDKYRLDVTIIVKQQEKKKIKKKNSTIVTCGFTTTLYILIMYKYNIYVCIYIWYVRKYMHSILWSYTIKW